MTVAVQWGQLASSPDGLLPPMPARTEPVRAGMSVGFSWLRR